MSLVDILAESGIVTTKEFVKSVTKSDESFSTWALVLLNDNTFGIAHIINSLIDILHINIREAQGYALSVYYKGNVVIKFGERDTLSELAEKFRSRGLAIIMTRDF